MNRGSRIIKLAGAIALVVASFFATLAIVDYYGVVPAPDALPIKIEKRLTVQIAVVGSSPAMRPISLLELAMVGSSAAC